MSNFKFDIESITLFVMMQYVMIVLKGSVVMSCGGTEEPSAYGELVSIGGLNPDANKKLSAAISSILESKLNISKTRFFLKFYDSKVSCCSSFGVRIIVNRFMYLLIASFSLFRPIKVKNMHSVCMLYTNSRSCKLTLSILNNAWVFFLVHFLQKIFNFGWISKFYLEDPFFVLSVHCWKEFIWKLIIMEFILLI